MARDRGKWCSVCKGWYRSATAVHLGTASHRRHAQPKRMDRGSLNKALGYATVHVRRAVAGPRNAADAGMVSVKKYRRRPPYGPVVPRSVHVRHYWRRLVAHWNPSSYIGR